jgi:hypothetical protein
MFGGASGVKFEELCSEIFIFLPALFRGVLILTISLPACEGLIPAKALLEEKPNKTRKTTRNIFQTGVVNRLCNSNGLFFTR